ncbi:MAG: DUF3221 domain-containing protein [Firmicutes bacterium]|nr:DUF3221 domain-containing protein [Bacillota bacterium]
MRKLTFLLFFVIAMLLTACANNKTFTATVLENNETSILVQPEANATEAKSADKITISLKDAVILDINETKTNVSEIKVGKKIEISYDGVIAESYPAQINNCYQIKLLD